MRRFSDLLWDIRHFFENIWSFRKELWRFRRFDHDFNLELYRRSLIETGEYIRDHGIHLNAQKDYESIMIAVRLIDRIIAEEYHDFYFDFVDSPCDTCGMKLVKKSHIPKSHRALSLYDNKKADLEYLYKFLNKHSQRWWD